MNRAGNVSAQASTLHGCKPGGVLAEQRISDQPQTGGKDEFAHDHAAYQAHVIDRRRRGAAHRGEHRPLGENATNEPLTARGAYESAVPISNRVDLLPDAKARGEADPLQAASRATLSDYGIRGVYSAIVPARNADGGLSLTGGVHLVSLPAISIQGVEHV